MDNLEEEEKKKKRNILRKKRWYQNWLFEKLGIENIDSVEEGAKVFDDEAVKEYLGVGIINAYYNTGDAGDNNGTGYAGGSGIVVIRYVVA